MSELVIYIIIAIIWGIISLIQKANKDSKRNSKKNSTQKKSNTSTAKRNINNRNDEEEIFKKLQKNIKDLQNLNNETLNKYESSNADREMLELQERYNSKIRELDNIRNTVNEEEVKNTADNKAHVNNMLTSLDIKNAIIYNAILEPKRINYRTIRNKKVN